MGGGERKVQSIMKRNRFFSTEQLHAFRFYWETSDWGLRGGVGGICLSLGFIEYVEVDISVQCGG